MVTLRHSSNKMQERQNDSPLRVISLVVISVVVITTTVRAALARGSLHLLLNQLTPRTEVWVFFYLKNITRRQDENSTKFALLRFRTGNVTQWRTVGGTCVAGTGCEHRFRLSGRRQLCRFTTDRMTAAWSTLLCRHEQGAAMAEGSVMLVLRQTGVCIATSWSGPTNLITGLADALVRSYPCCCHHRSSVRPCLSALCISKWMSWIVVSRTSIAFRRSRWRVAAHYG